VAGIEHIDYAFYSGTYRGRLDEATFERLIIQAAAYVDMLIAGRATASENERVALAQCAVLEALEQEEHGGPIVGETAGKYSVSRMGGEASPLMRIRSAAYPFLSGTGLLYRGVTCVR